MECDKWSIIISVDGWRGGWLLKVPDGMTLKTHEWNTTLFWLLISSASPIIELIRLHLANSLSIMPELVEGVLRLPSLTHSHLLSCRSVAFLSSAASSVLCRVASLTLSFCSLWIRTHSTLVFLIVCVQLVDELKSILYRSWPFVMSHKGTVSAPSLAATTPAMLLGSVLMDLSLFFTGLVLSS